MQRALVLAGNARPHPFRNQMRTLVLAQRKARDDSDVKLFVLSFAAFFVCFTTFIF
jgi:hypothetical protein